MVRFRIQDWLLTRMNIKQDKITGKFAFGIQSPIKGQLISKCLFGVSNSPKKRTWKLKFLP